MDGIELQGDLAGLIAKMPTTGGVPTSPTEPTGGANGGQQQQQQQPVVKPNTQTSPTTQQQPTGGELTDEQIQSKLTELEAKDEAQYTEEEKQFIQKYAEAEADEITAVKQNYETKYGIKLEGEYTNDMEGFTKLSEDVGRVRAEQIFVSHLESVPYMKDFYQHVVLEKKSFETFFEKNRQPEFKSIKLEQVSDDNDDNKNKTVLDNQKALITMDLKSKGMADDDISNLIELYEDKGNLFDKAKESYNSLDKRHKEIVDAKLKAEEARIQAEEQQQKELITKVSQMVDSNNFGGVSIPADDVKAFKQALFQPIDDQGNTLMDLKRQKMTLEQRVLVDYLVFKELKNIGLSAASASVNKKFTFKKAAVDNNNRGGGRLNGAGNDGLSRGINMPQFDMSKIIVEKQQI